MLVGEGLDVAMVVRGVEAVEWEEKVVMVRVVAA